MMWLCRWALVRGGGAKGARRRRRADAPLGDLPASEFDAVVRRVEHVRPRILQLTTTTATTRTCDYPDCTRRGDFAIFTHR